MPISTTNNSRNDEFAGKVAFVTGAGSGIGQATALAFAARGAAVAIADVSAGASRDVADEIGRTGGQALGLTCDVTVSSDVQTALRQTTEAFGRLDFAFNNAGIEQAPTPLADITEDQWQRVLDIDLRGVFLCMKYEIPLVLAAGGGAIINTSSGAGVRSAAPAIRRRASTARSSAPQAAHKLSGCGSRWPTALWSPLRRFPQLISCRISWRPPTCWVRAGSGPLPPKPGPARPW